MREEYAWVAEEPCRDARLAILRRFLWRDPLYRTRHFREAMDTSARANLRRALAELDSGSR